MPPRTKSKIVYLPTGLVLWCGCILQSKAYIKPIILENQLFKEICNKMSWASIGMDHDRGQPSKPQVNPSPSSILWVKVAHGCNRNLYPNIKIDLMMFLRRLPIIVPLELQGTTILSNLPRFSGSINEDSRPYIKRFVKLLITSLVTNYRYYLIWFLITLMDFGYIWYRFHIEGSFITWI